MIKDAQIRARMSAELKEAAEEVLDSLGLTATAAINMLYRQIVHRRAIPFEVSLPEGEADGVPAPRSQPEPRRRTSALTYGDFPHLFWNMEPNAPFELDDPTTFGRLLMRGDPDTVLRVVTLEEIARRLPSLPLQPETRAFWERVVNAGASG